MVLSPEDAKKLVDVKQVVLKEEEYEWKFGGNYQMQVEMGPERYEKLIKILQNIQKAMEEGWAKQALHELWTGGPYY